MNQMILKNSSVCTFGVQMWLTMQISSLTPSNKILELKYFQLLCFNVTHELFQSKIKVNGYTFRGITTLHCCLPYRLGSSHKGKNLLPSEQIHFFKSRPHFDKTLSSGKQMDLDLRDC